MKMEQVGVNPYRNLKWLFRFNETKWMLPPFDRVKIEPSELGEWIRQAHSFSMLAYGQPPDEPIIYSHGTREWRQQAETVQYLRSISRKAIEDMADYCITTLPSVTFEIVVRRSKSARDLQRHYKGLLIMPGRYKSDEIRQGFILRLSTVLYSCSHLIHRCEAIKCRKVFPSRRSGAKFCSNRCKSWVKMREYRKRLAKREIKHNSKGVKHGKQK